jgi:hypothetical protein
MAEHPCRRSRFCRVPCRRRAVPALRQGRAGRADPARALALLGEGGSLLPTTDAGLAEFLAWWGRLPAYRLSYGRLDEAAAAVRVLTDGQGASRNGAVPHRAPTIAF